MQHHQQVIGTRWSMTREDFETRVLNDLTKIKREVSGEGDYPGLRGRVQRLEDRHSAVEWWTRTAVGAAITAAVASVVAWFR